jgi:hypothetical protein
MLKKTLLEYRIRKKKAENHKGLTDARKKKFSLQKEFAKDQKLAKENPKEYKAGCIWIKKIIKYKKENKLIYFVGKQAEGVFKKYPELNSKEVVKSILVASINPKLDISQINKMVESLFSKSVSEKERKSIILDMIRSIKIENYEYLLP